MVLHWSQLPTGTPSESLSWAWPSPRLAKLEVLTLELLMLLVAPRTPKGTGERPPGTRTDQFTCVLIWCLEGWLQVAGGEG